MPFHAGKFTYFHMPKTGGSWVAKVLQQTQPFCVSMGNGHGSVCAVQGVSFGTCRNPWDWYLSWWQHFRALTPRKHDLLRYGLGSDGFKAVLWGATHPWSLPELPTDPSGIASLDLTASAIRLLQAPGQGGLWTWMTRHIYGTPFQVDMLVDTAHLYEGVSEVLGVRCDPQHFPVENSRANRRQSAVPGDPRDLYDAEMLSWVQEADGPLAGILGYSQPFMPAQAVIIRRQGA